METLLDYVRQRLHVQGIIDGKIRVVKEQGKNMETNGNEEGKQILTGKRCRKKIRKGSRKVI